jgi:hypothetical protein
MIGVIGLANIGCRNCVNYIKDATGGADNPAVGFRNGFVTEGPCLMPALPPSPPKEQ